MWLEQRVIGEYKRIYGDSFDPVDYFGSDIISHTLWYGFPAAKKIDKDGISWQKPLVNSLDDLNNFEFPDPYNESIYEGLDKIIFEKGNRYPVFVWTIGVLHLLDYFRSYEKIFLDMYDSPSKLKKMIERISYVLEKGVETVCKKKIDVLFIGDDLCDKKGLMMSPGQLDEFVLEYDGRLIEIARKHRIKVGFHSDGYVMPLLEKLVTLGVDIINPFQPTINDFKKFKTRYGNKLVVYGGLDNTVTLQKPIVDIEKHITDVFNILGQGGGLIMSSHEIPHTIPLAKIDKIAKIIREECCYIKKEV